MERMVSAVLLALALSACGGVSAGKYQAALAETGKAAKQVAEERRRTEAAEQRVAELEARLAAAEQRNRDLAYRLGEPERPAWGGAAAPAGPAATTAGLDPSAPRDPASITVPLPPPPPPSARAEAPPPQTLPPQSQSQQHSVEHQAMAAALAEELRAGRIALDEGRGRLTVRMAERVLFPTGSAAVSGDGRRALRPVADVLKSAKGRLVRVEVHTDSIPVRTDAFPSNWELSSARAAAVVRQLQALGVNPALLTGTGFADAQPLATNETSEGRAQNRRIEIVLSPAAPQGQPPSRAPMIFPLETSPAGAGVPGAGPPRP